MHYKLNHPDEYEEKKIDDIYYNVILEEDLYLFYTSSKTWNLCPCICITTKPVSGENPLKLHAPVRGYSLSNLYAEMVTTFYPHLRSPGINAFTTFKIEKSANILGCESLDEIRKKLREYEIFIMNNEPLPENDKEFSSDTIKKIISKLER